MTAAGDEPLERLRCPRALAVNGTPTEAGACRPTTASSPPTQTRADAQRQQISGELWRRPAWGSGIASVKAYRNLLPAGARGIEFVTPVVPSRGRGTPHEARWYIGDPGVAENAQGDAVIPITVSKNTQVP